MMRPDTKAKTGRADMALNLINKLDLKGATAASVWPSGSNAANRCSIN